MNLIRVTVEDFAIVENLHARLIVPEIIIYLGSLLPWFRKRLVYTVAEYSVKKNGRISNCFKEKHTD